MAKSRELAAKLSEESKIRGELDDVLLKLKVFEGAEHAKVLRDYQQRQRQSRALKQFGDEVKGIEARIRELAEDILPADVDKTLFGQTGEDASIVIYLDETLQSLQAIQKVLLNQAEAAAKEHERWQTGVRDSAWQLAAEQSDAAYRVLAETLRGYGAGDPSEYSSLVQRRQVLEQKQKGIADIRATLDSVLKQAQENLNRLLAMRRDLSVRRAGFLTRVLKDNPLVRISLQNYGRQLRNVEAQFRHLINREDDDAFSGDILSEDGSSGFIAEM